MNPAYDAAHIARMMVMLLADDQATEQDLRAALALATNRVNDGMLTWLAKVVELERKARGL
jgi:hypothetical protein